MTRLPPSASVAQPIGENKLFAPSALRNEPAITALLRGVAPESGRALEIASGTGQHVTAFAAALPGLLWQPTEIAADRIASIDAYAAEAALPNLAPARSLDASAPGWARDHPPYALIYMGNLLHLLPEPTAAAILVQTAQALETGGIFVIYGPFKRAGTLTSEGDIRFDAELRAADPAIGYKDVEWATHLLTGAGLTAAPPHEMPANNLALIARREAP